MKAKALSLAIVLLFSTQAFSFEPTEFNFNSPTKRIRAHDEGYMNFHVGIGFPSLLGSSTALWELVYPDVKISKFPPMHIIGEYGINEKWAAGLYLGFTNSKVTFTDTYDDFVNGKDTTIVNEFGWKQGFTIIGARGTYHFRGDKRGSFDPYITGMLGYNIASFKYFDDDPDGINVFGALSASGLAIAGSIGANFHFQDNMGAFVEIGYGVAILNFGLNIRVT
jgi:hypothetical protein